MSRHQIDKLEYVNVAKAVFIPVLVSWVGLVLLALCIQNLRDFPG